MKILNTFLIAAIGMMSFAQHAQAQSCSELYKQAQALRKNKNYESAIDYYQRARQCDSNLTSDCDRWIRWCNERLRITLSDTEVTIPYQGGDKAVSVFTSGTWKVEGSTDWCKTVNNEELKRFIVQCREQNNDIRNKVTTLSVRKGSLETTLRVVQQGRPEYIEVGAQKLSFPSKGATENVVVESNANWNVASVPSWCKVEKRDDGIHIIVGTNDRVVERNGQIIVRTPNKDVTIVIGQAAGDEHLTLSQNDLQLNAQGDTCTLKVYTDANRWFVGDFPTWLSVRRVDNEHVQIICAKNEPNAQSRQGSVQIRTDRQTASVMVTQAPRTVQDLIFYDQNLVGGRNISFGFTAGYGVPFISTSAGGDYVGSVVNYGLGTPAENASYKSASGFSFGAFADIRLFKNIFLIAGLNYTQVKYKNTFSGTTEFTQPHTKFLYMKGELQNNYTEEYTHSMLEVPILASYRFKINGVSHVQLNLGPVLNFGLSAKMKLSGNSDGDQLALYNASTHSRYDNNNYTHHTAVKTEFNLYQPCVYWEESYTQGNDAIVPHHDEFKDAPLHKFNCGLRVGAAYEWAGLSVGLSYTHMFTNMANKGYWENERFVVLNPSTTSMRGYKHRIHTLELKLAYTLRYLQRKK